MAFRRYVDFRTTLLAVCLVCSCRDAKAQEQPMGARGAYEMRLVRVGETYQGLRFKPATGEAWQIAAGKWETIAEAEAPPAGSYDIVLVATDENFIALRLEKATGATWILKARKWNRVKEPPAPKEDKDDPPIPKGKGAGKGFEIRHIRVGERAHIVRFHAGTGAAAHIERDSFEPLAEAGPVMPGDFDVTMIATDQRWMAFRLDRGSGATWLLQANTWRRVAEPE